MLFQLHFVRITVVTLIHKMLRMSFEICNVQVPGQPSPRHAGGQWLRLRRRRLPRLQRVCQGLQDCRLRTQIWRRISGHFFGTNMLPIGVLAFKGSFAKDFTKAL
jgi:hypothetical protein